MQYPEFPKRNSRRWSLHTNRHRTTNGNSWGWIDGPEGNICWSNDAGSKLTAAQASAAVNEHNEWLSSQRSIEVRLLEAQEHREAVVKELANQESIVAAIRSKLEAADALIAELSKQS